MPPDAPLGFISPEASDSRPLPDLHPASSHALSEADNLTAGFRGTPEYPSVRTLRSLIPKHKCSHQATRPLRSFCAFTFAVIRTGCRPGYVFTSRRPFASLQTQRRFLDDIPARPELTGSWCGAELPATATSQLYTTPPSSPWQEKNTFISLFTGFGKTEARTQPRVTFGSSEVWSDNHHGEYFFKKISEFHNSHLMHRGEHPFSPPVCNTPSPGSWCFPEKITPSILTDS